MNCSQCNKSLSGISSKVIEENRYCISCVADLFSKKTPDLSNKISKYSDKKCEEAKKVELTKTPRMARVSYILNTFYVWILFPAFITKILRDYPNLVFYKGVVVENGYEIVAQPTVLWIVCIILGILFTDSRIQDIGWNRRLSFLLWLPVLNIITCLYPGMKGSTSHGIKPLDTSTFKKLLASLIFVAYTIITTAFIALATVISRFI